MNTGAISSDTACGLEIEAVLQKYHKKFEITHSVILVDVPFEEVAPEVPVDASEIAPAEQIVPLEVVEEVTSTEPVESTDATTTVN